MTEPLDHDVWRGLERRLAVVESYIPDAPPWRSLDERLTPVAVRVHQGPAFGALRRGRAARPLVLAIVVVGLIAALIVATILVGGALRTAPLHDRAGRNGLIAYEGFDTQSVDGSIRILLANGAGQSPRPFGSDASGDSQRCPVFSPDGRLIAYLGSTSELHVASADGSYSRAFDGTRIVFSGGVASHGPRWSLDGTRIAMTAQGTGLANDVAIVTVADGSVFTATVPAVEEVVDIAWSPDGRRLAVMGLGGNTAQERNETSIFVLDSDGSNVRRVTEYPNGLTPTLGGLSWSPDGSQLLYSRWNVGPDLTNDIFLIRADGQGETDLTHSPGDDLVPAWSPDGGRIAYGTTDATGPLVVTINPDGSDPIVVDRGTPVYGVVWSPDSTRLLTVPGYDPLATAPLPMRSVAANGSGSPVNVGQQNGGCLPSWQRLEP